MDCCFAFRLLFQQTKRYGFDVNNMGSVYMLLLMFMFSVYSPVYFAINLLHFMRQMCKCFFELIANAWPFELQSFEFEEEEEKELS